MAQGDVESQERSLLLGQSSPEGICTRFKGWFKQQQLAVQLGISFLVIWMLLMIILGIISALAQFSQRLDSMSSQRAILDLGEVKSCPNISTCYDLVLNRRIKNHTMPAACSGIVRDGVADMNVAEKCSSWCHEAIGRNSAVPYMLSPSHMAVILFSNSSEIYMMCMRSQSSSWTHSLADHMFYVWALLCGLPGATG